MTKRTCAFIVALVLSTGSSAAFAQRQPPQPPQPDQGFEQHLFPPEVIMQFQQKINLRPEQRTTITQAIQQMQSKVIEVQWQMQQEVQKLTEIMQDARIQETEALAQVDRVLGMERDVKRANLTGLIRIKNALSDEQQSQLSALRDISPADSGTVRIRTDPMNAELRVGNRLLGTGSVQAMLPVGLHTLRISAPGTNCVSKEIQVSVIKRETVILLPPQTKLTCP